MKPLTRQTYLEFGCESPVSQPMAAGDEDDELFRALMKTIGSECRDALFESIDMAQKCRSLSRPLETALARNLEVFKREWADLEISDAEVAEKSLSFALAILRHSREHRKKRPYAELLDAYRELARKERLALLHSTGTMPPIGPPRSKPETSTDTRYREPPPPKGPSRLERLRKGAEEAHRACLRRSGTHDPDDTLELPFG